MVIDALENRPKRTCLVVIGDLNSDLDFPRDRQEILSSAMTAMALTCASNDYRVRKRRKKTHGRWMLHRDGNRGGGRLTLIRSKSNYFLIREQDWQKVKRCR